MPQWELTTGARLRGSHTEGSHPVSGFRSKVAACGSRVTSPHGLFPFPRPDGRQLPCSFWQQFPSPPPPFCHFGVQYVLLAQRGNGDGPAHCIWSFDPACCPGAVKGNPWRAVSDVTGNLVGLGGTHWLSLKSEFRVLFCNFAHLNWHFPAFHSIFFFFLWACPW